MTWERAPRCPVLLGMSDSSVVKSLSKYVFFNPNDFSFFRTLTFTERYLAKLYFFCTELGAFNQEREREMKELLYSTVCVCGIFKKKVFFFSFSKMYFHHQSVFLIMYTLFCCI